MAKVRDKKVRDKKVRDKKVRDKKARDKKVRDKKKPAAGGLVYSTDQGRLCPGCLRAVDACVCRDRSRPREGGDGVVRLERQTKGRKGAGVTLVQGLPLSDAELEKLARKLKAHCGVGGTLKDGVIELQGEQRERVKPLLEKEGFTVRISGG